MTSRRTETGSQCPASALYPEFYVPGFQGRSLTARRSVLRTGTPEVKLTTCWETTAETLMVSLRKQQSSVYFDFNYIFIKSHPTCILIKTPALGIIAPSEKYTELPKYPIMGALIAGFV